MLQLTHSDFHSHVEASAVLVVEFRPRSSAVPAAHPLSGRFPDVVYAAVDPEEEPDIARMFGLAATSALLIFREGIVLYLETGAHSAERIESLIERIRALDINEIRGAIAQERSEVAVHMRRMCPAARRGPMG